MNNPNEQRTTMSAERDEANAEALQHAQQVCADTLYELPADVDLDVAFAEFKRRLGISR